MTFSRRIFGFSAVIGLAAGLVACGGGSSSPEATKPAPAASAAAQTSVTKELDLIKTPRPFIDKLTEALRKGDLAAARQAYEDYDAAWNGIEVYTNYRSRQLYSELEVDIQGKIGQALDAPQPKLADIVPFSEAMAKKYDEVIALSQKGPPLSPLFDDLATLRIVRADLRIVTAALAANDAAKARAKFATFKSNYPKAQPLIKVRSTTADQEVIAAIAAADTKFSQPTATVDELKTLTATVTDRYNYGVNLLNAAARNADLSKKTYSEDDLKYLKSLNDAQLQLRASLTAWNSANYPVAIAATTNVNAAFEQVKAPLAVKSADAALKTALDGYTGMAGATGDAAKVAAANKAAVEAVAIAQQVLVGQFWTDPKLQEYVASLPKA